MRTVIEIPIGYGLTATATVNTDELDAQLDRLAAGVQRDPTELLEAVGRITRRSYGASFAAGGRPPWQALAPSTLARRQALIRGGVIPPKTATGKTPRRLLQRDRVTGEKNFGAWTILIRGGALRDSWAVKGARGNVSEVSGRRAFFGSQLTVERTLPPAKPIKQYHVVTKKGLKLRAGGQSMQVRIPLARIHEEGAAAAHIPARPVAHRPDGGANLAAEDLAAIRAAAVAWLMGTGTGAGS